MNVDKLYEDACKLAMYKSFGDAKDYKETVNQIYHELILSQKGDVYEKETLPLRIYG